MNNNEIYANEFEQTINLLIMYKQEHQGIDVLY